MVASRWAAVAATVLVTGSGLAAPAVASADGRITVSAPGYRLTLGEPSCAVSLDLRLPDGSWAPVTANAAGVAFGLFSQDEEATSDGLPVRWVRSTAGDALALAGRLGMDPLATAALDVHFLCADDGILVGGQLAGVAGAEVGSLWCPPRLTLVPGKWERYAFWDPDGRFRSGRLAELDPVPGYAGVSPWEQQGDVVSRLDAGRPALIVQPAAGAPGLGVVFVDYAGAWQGASTFLQRHTASSLFFYTGYAPGSVVPEGLRWAWLAPVAASDDEAASGLVRSLVAKAAELLAAYHPEPLHLAPGAEPVPDFPAQLRRTAPVADPREAMVYTINEGTRSAYGLDLARKVGSEVMVRAWFKWAQAPPVDRWRDLPAQAHAFGARFGGGITCSALYDRENGLTPEQVLDMATRGPDGALVDAWDNPGIRHGSLSSPAYLDYLFRWCREQIEAGADYLFMDEHTAALSEREGYDDYSLAAFRSFLLQEYPLTRDWADADPRWQAQLGIDPRDHGICPDGTVASLDYRAYLKAGGHIERPQRSENPLAGAWGEFRSWRDDRAWKQLTDRIRAGAAEAGHPVLISANGLAPYVDLQVLGVWGQWTTRDGHIDLGQDQVPYWRSLVVNGHQTAGRPVPVVLFHDWGFGNPPFPWMAVPPAERDVWMRTRGAEIFAAGAFFAFPVLGPFGCDARRDGTLRSIARQTAFYSEHRELYLGSRWLGRDGLVSDAGQLSLAATWCAPQKAVVLHVVNRDLQDGALRPRTAPVPIRVPLASAPITAVAVSPDYEGERQVPCRVADGRLEVTLGGLDAYSVAVLRYAAEPDLSGITDPCRVWPAKHWARPRRAEFRVLPGGLVENGWALEGFLQGMLHTHLRNPPVFVVNALAPAELRLRVRAVASAGARLAVRVDDGPVPAVDLPDLDGKNTDGPEYDRTLSFPLPAGSHRVAVDNTGGDWLILDWLEFAGDFGQPEGPGEGLLWQVKALQKPDDRARLQADGQGLQVDLVSSSGIGGADIDLRAPTAGGLPTIRVRLQYADGRPFTRLEGFSATLGSDAGEISLLKLGPAMVSGAEGITVRLTLPAGTPGGRLRVSWVDAYR